jgi:hypothetical protein
MNHDDSEPPMVDVPKADDAWHARLEIENALENLTLALWYLCGELPAPLGPIAQLDLFGVRLTDARAVVRHMPAPRHCCGCRALEGYAARGERTRLDRSYQCQTCRSARPVVGAQLGLFG